jgi:cupin fold WbuC family metalloprotein
MKTVTAEMIAELLNRAATAPRRRVNLNLHTEPSDPINRFLNAGVLGSYVQPHRHRVGKWELLNVLCGRLDVVIFSPEGKLRERFALDTKTTSLIEIPGGEWHGFIFCEPGCVVLEVKPGPYDPQLDKEFAEWAPPENDPVAALFLSWLEKARLGEEWPGTRERKRTGTGVDPFQ